MARRVVSVSVVQVLSHMIASVCVIFKTFLISFEGIDIIYKQDLSFSGKVLSDMQSGSYGDKLIKIFGHNEFLKSAQNDNQHHSGHYYELSTMR